MLNAIVSLVILFFFLFWVLVFSLMGMCLMGAIVTCVIDFLEGVLGDPFFLMEMLPQGAETAAGAGQAEQV